MNEIINIFFLAGDKFMPEMHLKPAGYTYSAGSLFTRNKERIKKIKETGDSRYICQNELDKAVKLDKCVGRCNTLNALSNKVCVPNKTVDLNILVLTKFLQKIHHANVNVNLMEENGITINVDVSVKKTSYIWKDYIWNPATCTYKNGKCLVSINDNSVITCDDTIEETKTIPANFNGKKTL